VLASVVIGSDVDRAESRNCSNAAPTRYILSRTAALEQYINDRYTNVLVHLIKTYKPEILIAGASTQGRTLMPYVAARINTG
jgi:electron transfer flavoprotein alpha subunit